MGFERYYFKGPPLTDWYCSLGTIEHGRYHKRLIHLFKAIFKVRSTLSRGETLYAFGLDMLMLAWLVRFFAKHKKVKLIYEVADIHSLLLGDSVRAKMLRRFERLMLKHVDLLVVTSQAYITEYYQKIQGMDKLPHMVIENKLEPADITLSPGLNPETALEQIHIGYFGVIRCNRSWEILKRAALRAQGQIKVYVRGIPLGIKDFEADARVNPYIDFDGAYVSPDDLPGMYGQVNLIWACYPYQGDQTGNWCWARTNRFYESCFYKKPMLAQLGTEDGRFVDHWHIGACIDLGDIEKAVARVVEISLTDIARWHGNIRHLARETFVYTDEHLQLIKRIQN